MKILYPLIVFSVLLCMGGCQEKALFKSPICDFSKDPEYILKQEPNKLISDDKGEEFPENTIGAMYNIRDITYEGTTSKSQKYTIKYTFMNKKLYCVTILIPNIQKEEVNSFLLSSPDIIKGEKGEFYNTTKSVAIITGIEKDKNGVSILYCNNNDTFQFVLEKYTLE